MNVGLLSAKGLLTRIVTAVAEEDGHMVFNSRYWSVFEKSARNGLFDLLIFDCPGICPFPDIRCLILTRSKKIPTVVIGPSRESRMGKHLNRQGSQVLPDPFYPQELLDMVRHVAENVKVVPPSCRPSPDTSHAMGVQGTLVELSPGLLLDKSFRCLWSGGLRIDLSPREYRLMECLLAREGQVVDYDTLLTEIWGADKGGYDGLYVVVRSLRKKLHVHPDRACTIENKYGQGYLFSRSVLERENCHSSGT
ncbi:winged helix family transcriptional regulator [Kyrpidia spormannii]|uniref:Uncharacterized protein n=2 Tax=Kyrpidia spormannii TaxID=2055160 RepID=A0ACA8Z979_9BACL|nr:winged helix family transcriptional regulator [Kyrpidia spormannii]CAB3392184.1 conserved protein of unknown function [Kyrpidia spormannii]CAB3393106.1 conserved protein of unknown function [Kyrpidia spormannii]